MKEICISFKNGRTCIWEDNKDGWDDYEYDKKCFIIKKNGIYIGIYNFDSIASIRIR
ncbi:MAG: hypothetical protein RSB70_06475 [Clostridium sp.]